MPTAWPLSRRPRTGIRLWTYLPRWQHSPRAWSLAVVVARGDDVLADVEASDRRPAVVPLEPGRHELVVEVYWRLETLTALPLVVELAPGQVLDLELVRPGRGPIGRKNVPVGIRERR